MVEINRFGLSSLIPPASIILYLFSTRFTINLYYLSTLLHASLNDILSALIQPLHTFVFANNIFSIRSIFHSLNLLILLFLIFLPLFFLFLSKRKRNTSFHPTFPLSFPPWKTLFYFLLPF